MQPWDGLPGSTARFINYGDTLICWGLGLGVGVIRALSVRGAAQQNQGDLGKPEREGKTPVSLGEVSLNPLHIPGPGVGWQHRFWPSQLWSFTPSDQQPAGFERCFIFNWEAKAKQ